MIERTERLKAVIVDLLANAEHNNEGWRRGMALEEVAGDMIAYADDAFTDFVEQHNDGGRMEPDWGAMEREIVAILREINLS